MSKILALLLFLVTMPAFAGKAGDSRCVRTAQVTRLDTLAISTCLWGYDGKSPDSPVAVQIRQTLSNVGKKPIEVQLAKRPTWLFLIQIYAGDREFSRRERIGDADGDFKPVEYRYVELKPGKSIDLRSDLADLMVEKPQADVKYRVYPTSYFDFRYLDESRESTMLRRLTDENEKGRPVELVGFENIEIR